MNELLEMVLEELPDAFRRHPGTAVDKVRVFREFAANNMRELEKCYGLIPDSLNRPLAERIEGLLARADAESQLAVRLRRAIGQLKDKAAELESIS